MPQDLHSVDRVTSSATNASWSLTTFDSFETKTESRREQSKSSRNEGKPSFSQIAFDAAILSRNAECKRNNSQPIPEYCEAWPAKTKTTETSFGIFWTAEPRPCSRFGIKSLRPAVTYACRQGWWCRRAVNVYERSDILVWGLAFKWPIKRLIFYYNDRCIWPDSDYMWDSRVIHGSNRRVRRNLQAQIVLPSAAPKFTITLRLQPLGWGKGTVLLGIRILCCFSGGMLLFIDVLMPICGGIVLWRNISITLITEETPEAASPWPILGFKVPTCRGCFLPFPKTFKTALHSSATPAWVPYRAFRCTQYLRHQDQHLVGVLQKSALG